MPALVRGVILLWAGLIAKIPNGFVICDGNNGTPDLTDRFIVGAGDSYDPDDTGGAINHVHTFTGDGHSHDVNPGPNVGAGANFDDETSDTAVTGTTNPTAALPPYYALAFIMKT